MVAAVTAHRPESTAGSWTAVLLAALGLGGCGSNKPELPPDLSAPASCVAPAYPAGPYGSEPGALLKNACFSGFSAPESTALREDALEPLALSDFYDPDGEGSVRVLLLNTAALWCAACQIEHRTLPDRYRELSPRGLALMTAVFQDERYEPADLSDLTAWVDTFQTNFPIVLDPGYSFGRYASAETAPLNLVVDPKTMTILEKFVGDQPAVMWPYIEALLAP
jgi:hypothetical protein